MSIIIAYGVLSFVCTIGLLIAIKYSNRTITSKNLTI